MGYDTEFEGQFAVEPKLRDEHAAYLNAFSRTRRVKRDTALTAAREDPVRLAAGLPVGVEGGFFVGEGGPFGGGTGTDVLDENHPPSGQPGLRCHWVPTADGSAITWDGQSKFYEYERWLAYLIRHFLSPWGYVVDGTVQCQGEDWSDPSELVVEGNRVFFWGAEV